MKQKTFSHTLAQNGIHPSTATCALPPENPDWSAANACSTCLELIRVSASTKNKTSPCAACAPALRAAAICRRSIRITFAPAFFASSAVASVEASSATIISYCRSCAASRMASRVDGSSNSSLCAGTMNDSTKNSPAANAQRPTFNAQLALLNETLKVER